MALTTASNIVSRCPSNTIDSDFIRTDYIERAEYQWTRIILGKDLYNAVVTEYNDGTPSWGSHETLYTDYILPALDWRAYALSIESIQNQVTDKGVQHPFGSNTTNTGTPTYAKGDAEEMADFLDEKLRQYLEENDYTLYDSKPPKKNLGGLIVFDSPVKSKINASDIDYRFWVD